MAVKTTDADGKIDVAKRLVRKYAIGSVAAGVLPFPLIDMGLIVGVQLKMMHHLCKIYETPYSEQLAHSVIASLVGGGSTAAIGSATKFSTGLLFKTVPVAGYAVSTAGSMIKSIPVLGTAFGVVATAGTAYSMTLAIGNIFIQHLEAGGTLLTFNAEKIKEHYAEQFGEGERAE